MQDTSHQMKVSLGKNSEFDTLIIDTLWLGPHFLKRLYTAVHLYATVQC